MVELSPTNQRKSIFYSSSSRSIYRVNFENLPVAEVFQAKLNLRPAGENSSLISVHTGSFFARPMSRVESSLFVQDSMNSICVVRSMKKSNASSFPGRKSNRTTTKTFPCQFSTVETNWCVFCLVYRDLRVARSPSMKFRSKKESFIQSERICRRSSARSEKK